MTHHFLEGARSRWVFCDICGRRRNDPAHAVYQVDGKAMTVAEFRAYLDEHRGDVIRVES
jgi:hypothetical protein